MHRHIGEAILSVAFGFGTLAVIGSIVHQQSQEKLARLHSKLVKPSARLRQAIVAAAPAPQPAQSVVPKISEIPQPSIALPDQISERLQRKTPEEREALRAQRAEKRARREERMQRRAAQQQQSA